MSVGNGIERIKDKVAQHKEDQARLEAQRQQLASGGTQVKVESANIPVEDEVAEAAPQPAKAPKPKAEKFNYLAKAPERGEFDDVYESIEEKLAKLLPVGMGETPTTVQPYLINILTECVKSGTSKEKLVVKSMLNNGGILDVSNMKLLKPTEDSVASVRQPKSNWDELLALYEKGAYTLTDVAKIVGSNPECIWVYPLFIRNGWNDMGTLQYPTKMRKDKKASIPRTTIATIGEFLRSQGVL